MAQMHLNIITISMNAMIFQFMPFIVTCSFNSISYSKMGRILPQTERNMGVSIYGIVSIISISNKCNITLKPMLDVRMMNDGRILFEFNLI